MSLTLLLDLDDTLLNTNQEVFVPAYFQALAKELSPHVAPEVMMRALVAGTSLMNESDDFSRTLEEVFASVFYPTVQGSLDEYRTPIERFYDEIFPSLSKLTTPKPAAKPFVDWAFSRGYRIAIATDPLLPRKATYHRLCWAGFDPAQFELVSSFEHFHFSKTHPAYYAEVLGRLGWPDGPVLMVGNDMGRDIIPAKKLGLATYYLDEGSASRPGPEADASGDMQSLRLWLESTDLAALTPSFKSRDGVLGVLASTPAVLRGLSFDLQPAAWTRTGESDDWSFLDLICHLRDTEREIHHMQIRLFQEKNEPFIPRPDTGVWASQRDYQHENGAAALGELVAARKETMALLASFPPEDWSRKARHAIFGPTNFLEVAGFIADHDRLHIQQAWRMLKRP